MNEIAGIAAPTQAVLFPGLVTVGTGFTVAITAVLPEVHPLAVVET